MPEERLLDAKEVATILGIHWRTVINLAKAGEIAYVLVAGKHKFTREDVDEYISRHRRPPRKEK
jgi:excisionase family DNA binding protein